MQFILSTKRFCVGAVLSLALNVSSFATLTNSSFENPAVGVGQYTSDGIPGWSSSGHGVWHIPTGGFFETTAPDGLQVAYSNGTAMAQQSSNFVGLGANTVTVQGGRRHDGFAGSFDLKVWAGGTVTNGNVTGGTLLATATFDHTLYPIDSFTMISATYTALPGDPNLGKFITVQFVRTAGSQMNLDDVRISSPSSETVSATGLTLNLGKITSGNVTSLQAEDGNSLTVCKFFIPNQNSPFIQFVVTGNTTFTTPIAFRTRLVSKMVDSGAFNQTIRLFNFTTNAYDESRTDALPTSFSDISLGGTGLLSRYLGANGLLQTMIQIKQVGPAASVTPCAQFEYSGWDISQ